MAKMNKNNVLKPVDVNSRSGVKSPARKRARYESPAKERFSVSSNIVLDEIKDCGLGILESESSPEYELSTSDLENLPSTSKGVNCTKTSGTLQNTNTINDKEREIEVSLLQASLSKDTIKKLTIGEWDEFIIKKEETGPETINYFDLLSDEMVLHIFQFLPKIVLPRISLVCRRWNRLTLDESLWARMDLSCRIIPAGAMGHILSRQVILLKLAQSEIGFPPFLPGSKADSPTFKARTLYLDMSMVHCSTPDTVALIFSKCYRLKKVSLENVAVNYKVIENLCESKELEVLNLAMVTGLTLDGIKVLLTRCRNLRQLNLAWTSLNSGTINYICKNLPPTMDRLNLSGCRKGISDKNVLELVQSCPRLRELDLSDCTGLTGESLNHMTKLEQLNFLALSRCYLIPCRALLILKRIPSLMYLDVHGGYIEPAELRVLQDALGSKVTINKFKFSSVARPTVGPRHSHIWNMRIKDNF